MSEEEIIRVRPYWKYSICFSRGVERAGGGGGGGRIDNEDGFIIDTNTTCFCKNSGN